ncbi:hypothetical protein I79_016993 [Cricetulus griseus]|uniref:Uncharacterized protein n=1 Tax=Cricetulus griseus TaxID=10029 RepID=G3I0V2_CRIGR|nr:hypothetical protein I79_016993 [Cricetulus griseus]
MISVSALFPGDQKHLSVTVEPRDTDQATVPVTMHSHFNQDAVKDGCFSQAHRAQSGGLLHLGPIFLLPCD